MKDLRPMLKKSSIAAYRADREGAGAAFGGRDRAWLIVSSVLENATLVIESERLDVCRRAIALALTVMGEPLDWIGGGWPGELPAWEAVVRLADDAYESGALNLAETMLTALLQARENLGASETGLVVARLARVTSKLGLLDEAADLYRWVGRLGREKKSPELKVRAWIGLGAISQMKGNYPEMERLSMRACAMAEKSGLDSLARYAHNGLMIAHGAQHRFDRALVHGWAAVRACKEDTVAEGEVLQNMGQLLLEAGHTHVARATFALVLSRRLPVRIILPALGGLALASAATGRQPQLAWAAAQVLRLSEMPVPRYPLASALLECALALFGAGEVELAKELRDSAVRIARIHGFHEITVRADSVSEDTLAVRVEGAAQWSPAALKVTRTLESLEPERLPSHALVAAAPG